MRSITTILMTLTFVLSSIASNAQIKNAKTETVKVYGNCGMCEKIIEKAGNVKKVSAVEWNKDTQMATITYDTKKTNKDEILKRIALVGYDSDSFLAPDDVYANLHGCCQYERAKKTDSPSEMSDNKMKVNDHSGHKMVEKEKAPNQLTSVFDTYFAVKDALVKTDGAMASEKAVGLMAAIKAVKMDKLEMDVHMVWMKVLPGLQDDAKHIAENKETSHQREHFVNLSANMYKLMKAAKHEQPVYYQFCPMANDGKGANWLSKENAVKNPYYGSKMLSCGKTVETIE